MGPSLRSSAFTFSIWAWSCSWRIGFLYHSNQIALQCYLILLVCSRAAMYGRVQLAESMPRKLRKLQAFENSVQLPLCHVVWINRRFYTRLENPTLGLFSPALEIRHQNRTERDNTFARVVLGRAYPAVPNVPPNR